MVGLSLQHLTLLSWLILHRSALVGKQNLARSCTNNRVSEVEGYVSSLLSIMKPDPGETFSPLKSDFSDSIQESKSFS